MTEVERIADQMRRGYDGDAWHGTPLRKLLEGVTAARAAYRQRPGLHSIWELVLHLVAVKRMVVRRLGGTPTELTPAEEWPPVADTSEPAWQATLAALDAGRAALLAAVEALDDSRLDEPVPGKDYVVYVMLHGDLQHDLYHAGQIALLKNLAAQG